MKVSKWGNSLAVRIPAAIAEELNLKEGDDVQLRQLSGRDYLIERGMTRQEAIEAIRKSGMRLPKGYRFKRLDAYV